MVQSGLLYGAQKVFLEWLSWQIRRLLEATVNVPPNVFLTFTSKVLLRSKICIKKRSCIAFSKCFLLFQTEWCATLLLVIFVFREFVLIRLTLSIREVWLHHTGPLHRYRCPNGTYNPL